MAKFNYIPGSRKYYVQADIEFALGEAIDYSYSLLKALHTEADRAYTNMAKVGFPEDHVKFSAFREAAFGLKRSLDYRADLSNIPDHILVKSFQARITISKRSNHFLSRDMKLSVALAILRAAKDELKGMLPVKNDGDTKIFDLDDEVPFYISSVIAKIAITLEACIDITLPGKYAKF